MTSKERMSVVTNKFKIIAGPCSVESVQHVAYMASSLQAVMIDFPQFEFVFKASVEKANRTSATSFSGIGFEQACLAMATTKDRYQLKVTTDIHEPEQIRKLGSFVDYLQIPAFLCRQTNLIKTCAESGIPTNVKKGQFLAPEDTKHIVEKFKYFGGTDISIVERGTSFGYGNLIVDFCGLPTMRQYAPVIFDATHSVQKPNSGDGSTGGNRDMVPYLIKAACAVGVDGIFMEVHNDPDNAKSDGANSLHLDDFRTVVESIAKLTGE